MDFLEYNDVSYEVRGYMTPGRLKMTDQNIIFKNSKTGRVEQISPSDIDVVNFQKFVGTWGIRIFTKQGQLHRFRGFKEGDNEKIAKFFKEQYKKDMLEQELFLKGWNWGIAKFNGNVLTFGDEKRMTFEIPLNHVSQCQTGKNEVTLEFHQNDDAPVGLLEMRFHIPSNESGDNDPVESFYDNVLNKASVISVSGDAIAIFREVHCLTPRGRYDIKVFQTFFQLHGKTFDYKIPMSTVLRMFFLPHKDQRQNFFVLSLDPPIKQGQTRYHFLVLLFGNEEEITLELPFSEQEIKEKYEGKITKELSGPVYEVMGKIMKVLVNRKITGPGNFVGHSGTAAIGCSFKAAAGYLYPLERGFMYIHKPPLHIRFEEIVAVNFARSGGSTRSFDFEIELKSGTIHTFSSIEKEEYGKLFDFIKDKKLHVKNTGKNDKAAYKEDFGDSDNEAEPDAYLERVKAEAKERESADSMGSEEESTDEDFKPGEQESEVEDEYDSDVQDSSSDDEEDGSGGEKKKKKKEKKEKKKEKTVKKSSSSSKKKNKDSNKPKRAATAFMLWLNENREQIKKDNPGISITEIAKKGGELWRDLKDKSKWEEKSAKDKERYQKEMEEYKEKGGGGSDDEGGDSKASKKRKKESPTKKPSSVGAGAGYKSKEYISDDESSSDGGDKKKNKKDDDNEKKSTSDSKSKKDKKSDDEDEESEAEMTDEGSGGGSEDE
ncbi:FACT complex subunit Ssrp1 [Condylostylus longicornis]|uniref:FACT complex subunit Ssrp1 n=1 Tax=Condylostylus longicornis TaxID=2530218 RepID=UPI00244DCB0C|nr:FACT complex subunit Ssrp1 [Condylostylus longicornis]